MSLCRHCYCKMCFLILEALLAAHRKLLASPIPDREKGRNLKRSETKTAKGSQKLEQNKQRRIKLQAHVTAMEYEKLNDQFQATGIRYLSEYQRLLILDRRRSDNITNKKELIMHLDGIGAQISKIGNNINQIA